MRYQLCIATQSKSLAALAYMYRNFLVCMINFMWGSLQQQNLRKITVGYISELQDPMHFRAQYINW